MGGGGRRTVGLNGGEGRRCDGATTTEGETTIVERSDYDETDGDGKTR